MADTLTRSERSERMQLIRSKNTTPEVAVRRMLFAMGYRYRLHAASLPGKPDIVFKSRKKIVFVHGCFWHRHEDCRLARLPKSRLDYWAPKLEANAARDAKNAKALRKLGWRMLVVWECETADRKALAKGLRRFLSG